MFVHYDETTLRVTGITTFNKAGTEFTAPTIDILAVVVDKPLNEYTVSTEDKKITWVGKSEETILSDLERIKEEQKSIIRVGFDAEVLTQVVVDDISWFGGDISVTKLDGAKRLSEMGGATTVTFFDVDNVPHTLTLTEAETVILTIGVKYQTDFAKKQTLFNAISTAVDVEEVLSYNW